MSLYFHTKNYVPGLHDLLRASFTTSGKNLRSLLGASGVQRLNRFIIPLILNGKKHLMMLGIFMKKLKEVLSLINIVTTQK